MLPEIYFGIKTSTYDLPFSAVTILWNKANYETFTE